MSSMIISFNIFLSTYNINADTVEDEFLSVINKYNIEDIIVEEGILLEKGDLIDIISIVLFTSLTKFWYPPTSSKIILGLKSWL